MPKNLLVLLHFIYTGDCIHPHKTVFPKRNSKIPYPQPRRIESKVLYFSLQFAVQGTLKSLLQHHSSKASILWRSAFFIVKLSHPYMTTGETIAVTRRIFSVSSILNSEQIARAFLSCLLCYPLTRLDLERAASTLGKGIVNEHYGACTKLSIPTWPSSSGVKEEFYHTQWEHWEVSFFTKKHGETSLHSKMI